MPPQIRYAVPTVRLQVSKAHLQKEPFVYMIVFVLLAACAFAQEPQVIVGDTNIESSLDGNPSGTAEAFPVQATATGKINSLSVYLDRSNSAQAVWVGMYTNANGHPQAMLSNGLIGRPVVGQWNTISISSVQLTKGTTYWLALLGANGVVRFRDRNGNCRSEVSNQTNLGSLPATWSSGQRWTTCIVSMFETGMVTGGSAPATVGISVVPHSISLQAGQRQQFAAAVTGLSNPVVTWIASAGTIGSSGLYTAPSSAGTYTVTAKAGTSRRGSKSTTALSDSAFITVTPASPTPVPTSVNISISPTAASIQTGGTQQFTALVSGTSNPAVTWSASNGTIAANGLYTAPGTAGTDTITAVSSVDKSKSASALVVVGAPQAVVTISPANASVAEGNQLQFSSAIVGMSNKAVTWRITQGSGTITQTGLYTAPKSAESDVVTATSQADATKSSSVSVAVVPPHSVALFWNPSQSTSVIYYRVYRGTVSGGPYTLLGSNIATTSYMDASVKSGTVYYYATTAVSTAGVESIFSNEFTSVIPSP